MSESAVTRTVIVANRAGLHLRAALILARAAQRFDARIRIAKGNEQVEAKDVMQLMMLAAEQGETLLLEACGPEAPQALDTLEELFLRKFDED
jgi:phosphotransferase system HPr (HPr) family protein